MEKIINFLRSKEKFISFFLSGLMTLVVLALVSIRNNLVFSSIAGSASFSNRLYFLTFIVFLFIPVYIIFVSENISWKKILRKLLWIYLAGEMILLFELFTYKKLNYWMYFFTALYIIIWALLLMAGRKFHWKETEEDTPSFFIRLKNWIANQGKLAIFLILTVVISNFSFSAYQVDKFAAVDEPLWLFGRISAYWNNLGEMNWEKTYISDKPGVTVAILSGAGLLKYEPDLFDTVNFEGKVYKHYSDFESFFLSFRLPIVLFSALSLFLFYFFLEKLLTKKQALLSLILIGLSPILVGMNRIINPDSLLWIFSSLSVISYLAYLKKRDPYLLYFAGIFLGLGLLTKYVITILFIFFFGLIFLEYVLRKEKYEKLGIQTYLKQSLVDYLLLWTISIITFIALCPAAWVKPEVLLLATVKSQAFHPVFRVFLAILSLLLLDTWAFKNYFLRHILDFLEKRKRLISIVILAVFLFSIILVFINVYSGMKIVDFESVLASPKSAYKSDWNIFPVKIFTSNFYPLVFGISPWALLAIVFGSILAMIKRKNNDNDLWIPLYLVTFILIYYLGSTVTGVASTIRYQIILYPVIMIISGIFMGKMIDYIRIKRKIPIVLFYVFLMIICLYPLLKTAPLYSGYASTLLPKSHYIDIKDMGAGSYEAAQFLNSLPDHQNLNIWTDKTGVCYFFKGNCYTGFAVPKSVNLDYLVLSSGRESRTGKMSHPTKFNTLDFAHYYDLDKDLAFRLNIDGRPSQYVKIIDLKIAGQK